MNSFQALAGSFGEEKRKKTIREAIKRPTIPASGGVR